MDRQFQPGCRPRRYVVIQGIPVLAYRHGRITFGVLIIAI